MQITWHGQYTVKIASKDLTIVLDPYAPSVGLSPFRAKAEIVGLTNPSLSDMSHTEGIQGTPLVIDSPGEYSFDGVNVYAPGWNSENGTERSLQRWIVEDVIVLHLGALDRELTNEELQMLGQTGIDILLVPVGGGSGLNAKQAIHMVTTIEPRIVIPIHYALSGVREKLDDVKAFAEEMGVDPKKAEKKFTIRANKLPQEDVETVILRP